MKISKKVDGGQIKITFKIGKSKKKGIRRNHQKTYHLETVAPKFTLEQMDFSIKQEAKRWENEILKHYKKPMTIDEMAAKGLL